MGGAVNGAAGTHISHSAGFEGTPILVSWSIWHQSEY